MGVDAAVKRIQGNLNESPTDWDVSTQELQDITQTIDALSPAERNHVIERLSDEELQHWADETQGLVGALSADERRDLLNTLAGSLDGEQAARVAQAFGATDMAQAVAVHATSAHKADFIAAMQSQADGSAQVQTGLGSATTTRGNDEAMAIAQVLGSMGASPQELSQAVQGLQSAGTLDDVMQAAAGYSSTTFDNGTGMSMPVVAFNETQLTDILEAVSGLPPDDPARVQAFAAAQAPLASMQGATGAPPLARLIDPTGANAESAQHVADAMGQVLTQQQAVDAGLLDIPSGPPGVWLDANIAAAESHASPIMDGAWFYNQVKGGGPMDYKGRGRRYEDFGNFNFGVVAAAIGIPEEVGKAGAGAYQVFSGTSDPSWWNAYFDDPNDQAQIAAGYDYYQSGMWRVWPND